MSRRPPDATFVIGGEPIWAAHAIFWPVIQQILIYSPDPIAASMGGAGVRALELGRVLAAAHNVRIAAPGGGSSHYDGVDVVSTELADSDIVGECDVVISQTLTAERVSKLRKGRTRLIVDMYDPVLFEQLEVGRWEPTPGRARKHASIRAQLNAALQLGDAFICASERQRDMWLGALASTGRIGPSRYDSDPDLRGLIDVVPFGLPEEAPRRTGPGLRARHGLGDDQFVALWGGGIWNWFDPATVIRAVGIADERGVEVNLAFLGIAHPSPSVPKMRRAADAVEVARDLGLLDRLVHFNEAWVPYAERQNYFLDADIGVTAHFPHTETRFSFRTRMLDYFWARLPVVCTSGDALSETVAAHGLGAVVRPEDPGAMADAFCLYASDPALVRSVGGRLAEAAKAMTWTVAAEPLLRMIEAPERTRPGRRAYAFGAASLAYHAAATGSKAERLRRLVRGVKEPEPEV